MTTPVQEKVFPSDEAYKIPRAFILRRLHSLLGMWLVLYLVEHLIVNSQMALFFDNEGTGFVAMVNEIHALPYLPIIELLFLGIPFAIHGIWGIIYLKTSKANSFRTDGTSPALTQYRRNSAYTWQRITSWLLVVGIAAHVIHMRFMEYPTVVREGMDKFYLVKLKNDASLDEIVPRLHVALYDENRIDERKMRLDQLQSQLMKMPDNVLQRQVIEDEIQNNKNWISKAEKISLKKGEIIASAPNPGTAFLLILRETFKNPVMVILYSLLVIASAYHAFNGLWTLAITWGITLTRRSQKTFRTLTTILMLIVMFLGLMATWGTYFTILANA